MLGPMCKLLRLWFGLTLLCIGLGSGPSWAQESQFQSPHVLVKLVSKDPAWQAGQSVTLGLHFKLIPHWHTYWINPGDSGEPPKVQWTSSLPDLRFSSLQFPTPSPIPVGPLMNFGYSNEVTLLSTVEVPATADSTKPLEIQAKLTWLVCEEECIPEKADLRLTLPPAGHTPPKASPAADLIAQAQKNMPQAWNGGAIPLQNEKDAWILHVPWPSTASNPEEIRFFPRHGGQIANSAPQEFSMDQGKLELRLPKDPQAPASLESLQGVLVADSQAFQISAIPSSTQAHWALYLGLAFLGGLILNLMPCVFPVLSIKILHWVHQAQQEPRQIRRQGWAYTFGILATFGVLSLLLVSLRLAGQAVGWGFQFQSPHFNMALGFLFFLMGLALLGVLSINLPGSANFFSRQTTHGLKGAFFTGVLATIAATPCMAPLVGPTLGLALAQASLFGVALLTAMALGLAAPSLFLSYFPKLLKKLPRPGPWMQTLEQFLAFPLFATVLWIYWVLQQQGGTEMILPFWGGLLMLSFGIWWLQRLRSTEKARVKNFAKRIPPWIVIVGTMVWSFSQAALQPNANTSTQSTVTTGIPWQEYSNENLQQYRNEGRPVFINFTAAWCVTCQVNDRLVFRNPEVMAKFSQQGIIPLKADWTHPDATITEALKAYGRQGVPLYVFYDRAGNFRLLPEILTPGLLLEAITVEKADES